MTTKKRTSHIVIKNTNLSIVLYHITSSWVFVWVCFSSCNYSPPGFGKRHSWFRQQNLEEKIPKSFKACNLLSVMFSLPKQTLSCYNWYEESRCSILEKAIHGQMCIMEIHDMDSTCISIPNFPSTKESKKWRPWPFFVVALKKVVLNSSTKSFLKFFSTFFMRKFKIYM